MKKYITYFILFFIMTGALFYRLEHMRNTPIPYPIRSDAKQYVHYALNLIQYGTLNKNYTPNQKPSPDSFRTPGYPFFLASVIKVVGLQKFYNATRWIQAFLGTITVLLTFCVARLFMPRWASLLASLFVALSPHLISAENYILTETLFSFFLLVSVYLFCQAGKTESIPLYALSGLFFGYTYLVTPTIFFIPWIFAIMVLAKTGMSNKKVFIGMVLFCTLFSIILGGYALRNHVNVTKKEQSRLLIALCAGIYPDFIYKSKTYQYYPYKEDPEVESCVSSFKDFSSFFRKRAQQDPLKYFSWYFWGKPRALWSWNILQGAGDVYIYEPTITLYNTSAPARFLHKFMKLSHPVILFLFFAGIIIHLAQLIMKKTSVEICVSMIMALLLYYTFIFMALFPLPRYTIPLRPELYIFAAWTLQNIFKIILTRGTKKNSFG